MIRRNDLRWVHDADAVHDDKKLALRKQRPHIRLYLDDLLLYASLFHTLSATGDINVSSAQGTPRLSSFVLLEQTRYSRYLIFYGSCFRVGIEGVTAMPDVWSGTHLLGHAA